MTLQIEDIVDGGVSDDEALGLALGAAPRHLSLSLSDWEMPLLALQNPQYGSVGGEAVGDDSLGQENLVIEQFPEQFQCCFIVSQLLDEHVEYLAHAIDGTTHVHELALYPNDHLVERRT